MLYTSNRRILGAFCDDDSPTRWSDLRKWTWHLYCRSDRECTFDFIEVGLAYIHVHGYISGLPATVPNPGGVGNAVGRMWKCSDLFKISDRRRLGEFVTNEESTIHFSVHMSCASLLVSMMRSDP
jgi:hypothetical protein